MRRFTGTALFAILMICSFISRGQLLPPFRSEQNACGALTICSNGFFTPYSYQGIGVVSDMPNTPCGSGEQNGVWLKLVITASGTIVFNITPQVMADDYDFAVINGTGKSCDNLKETDVVRCNFNQNQTITNNGVVGLSASSTEDFVGVGVLGHNYASKIDAVAGQTYYIMINNSGNGAGNNIASGFNITFAGSTAVFADVIPPTLKTVAHACNTTSATIDISENIKCTSIAPDGSDFSISPSGTIIAASGLNCNSLGQGYSNRIFLTFATPLAAGTYTISSHLGTDGNTLLDLCDNQVPIPDNIIIKPENPQVNSVDVEGCNQVVYQGKVYTESTALIDTVINKTGCDSVYNVVNIIVDKLQKRTDFVESCDSVIFEGKIYFQNTTLVDTFKNRLGCDSLVRTTDIAPQHFQLQISADPPEPVIGDHITFTTSSNVNSYSVNSWKPTSIFPFQNALENTIVIRQSDTIQVIGTSYLGCIDTVAIYIQADTLIPKMIMPNAFSPNGDGINDIFEPKFYSKSGYVIKSFRVYNRWGQIVYSAAGTKKASWNGYFTNGEKKADVGTYFYYIDVLYIDGTKTFIKGDVTLLR